MPSRQKFTHAWHVPGTLGADLDIRFTAPSNCTLVHVSAVGSNAYAAGLTIGTSDSAAEFMAKSSIGVSGTPVEFGFDDFATYASKAYPRIEDGDIVIFALDYNYNNGGSANASADVTIVATFLEG
jgi:hypothetical protein